MNAQPAKKTPWRSPMPSFFDPANAAKGTYRPNIQKVFDEAQDWRRSVRPAASDKKKLHLALIDVQKDFCFPDGSLYVAGRSGTGAIDDSRRMAEFIYRNLSVITRGSFTLDTHISLQIFSRSFWEKEDGSPIAAHTVVTADDIRKGVYRPTLAAATQIASGNLQWLTKQAIHYCEELEKAGKYQLYIWPEHCLLGTDGHTLVGVIQEAAYFHAYARGVQTDFPIKGGNPLFENYSPFEPEVMTLFDGRPIPGAQKNTKFLSVLLEADYVALGGQAASHCVASAIDSILRDILAKDPALARKIYLMEDCMSAVTVPDGKGGFIADFTPQAEAALKRFADAGMHLVKSTDPIDSWPDLVL